MSIGSVFRKWDLHVHTPESYKNQYELLNKEDSGAHLKDLLLDCGKNWWENVA